MTADVERMRALVDRWLDRTDAIGDALLVTGEDRAEHWRHDLRKLRDRLAVDAGRRRGVSPTFALHLSNFERRADNFLHAWDLQARQLANVERTHPEQTNRDERERAVEIMTTIRAEIRTAIARQRTLRQVRVDGRDDT